MTERENQNDESRDARPGYVRPAKSSEQAVQTFGDSYRREKPSTASSSAEEGSPREFNPFDGEYDE